jgi:hypothetical protein
LNRRVMPNGKLPFAKGRQGEPAAPLLSSLDSRTAPPTHTFSTDYQTKAERGIRVNGVAPGPIWTPLIPSTFRADQVAVFGGNTPMKRPGQPAEVGPAYVFLASDDASYITGQFIHVNGGEMVNG